MAELTSSLTGSVIWPATAARETPSRPPPHVLYRGCSARSSTIVRAPAAAEALAAASPAGPPPTTATSHSLRSCTRRSLGGPRQAAVAARTAGLAARKNHRQKLLASAAPGPHTDAGRGRRGKRGWCNEGNASRPPAGSRAGERVPAGGALGSADRDPPGDQRGRSGRWGPSRSPSPHARPSGAHRPVSRSGRRGPRAPGGCRPRTGPGRAGRRCPPRAWRPTSRR